MKLKTIIAYAIVGLLAFSAIAERNPDDYEERLVDVADNGAIYLLDSPHGKPIYDSGFFTGDKIRVNPNFREDGWCMAWDYGYAKDHPEGLYGYVDADSIVWQDGQYRDGRESVTITANVNIRSKPDKESGEILGTAHKGQKFTYAGEVRYNTMGNVWYAIYYDGGTAWVSSRYSYHNDADPDRKDVGTKEGIELSEYYLDPLPEAARALGLNTYEKNNNSETPHQYTNGPVRIGGFDEAKDITLKGFGYTIYGVAPGMDRETAKGKMVEAGLALDSDEEDQLSFEHPVSEKSPDYREDYDGIIYVNLSDGKVQYIDWWTYSG